jgi:FKBP-type peptidyl-prolyl cis-trans isomerase FklB
MKKTTVGKMRQACGLLVLVAVAAMGAAQTPPPASNPAAATRPPPAVAPGADPAPPPSPEQISYLFGLVFGAQMHSAGISNEVLPDSIARGIKEGLAGKVPSPGDQQQIQTFVRSVGEAASAKNQSAAKDFLARNGHEKGVVTTASGLQYKIIEAGDKKAPAVLPTDTATVEYRGKLIDGSEFDSSYSRGVPATFPVSGVIKGWQEALVLMKPGAKWQLFISPELAYGSAPKPKIPGGSLLIFDVHLLSAEGGGAPKAPPGTPPKTKP